MKFNDLTGKKFGRLTVIERMPNNANNKVVWRCKCDCGNEAVVIGSRLYTGKTVSCGCVKSEKTTERNTKHGYCGTRLYATRMNMISRCTNEKNRDYADYGGRGISVCDEWLNKDTGVAAFVEWALANGYQDGLTIDRIDVNGNYEPNNCRWVTMEKQSHNRRRRYNRTGVTGITINPHNGRFVATITVHKKRIALGSYDTLEEATEARRKAEQQYKKEWE
jgi:hypothetical protein